MLKETKSLGNYRNNLDKSLEHILDKSFESYDKLPMLQIIFEKISRTLNISLRKFMSEPTSVDIKNYSSQRFSTYISSLSYPSSMVIYKIAELESFGMIHVENDLSFEIVDVLLGGKKNENKSPLKNKYPTFIEQEIITQFSKIVLKDVEAGFSQVLDKEFKFDKIESNPNFVNICRPGEGVISLSLSVKIDNRIGSMSIIIPYSVIKPVKHKLQQIFLGEQTTSDSQWHSSLMENVKNINIPVCALLKGQSKITLLDATKLKVGDNIILSKSSKAEVELISGNVVLAKGEMGKIKDNKAITVTYLK